MSQEPAPALLNSGLESALEDARARLAAAHPQSLARHRAAAAALPGGNTRAVLYYDPFPLTFTGGAGCRVTTLDGVEMVDLVSEYSAGLYGHSDPVIAAALKTAVDGGIALGAPNIVEARYAAALVDRFPGFERVRFCNSGTEANIMALSTARAVTGRGTIIAMAEGYHGGVLTFAHGGSELNLPFPFAFATYNDIAATRALIRERADDLAAVILEPMMGGGGCIPADREFLAMIREETRAAGALMILDEVMTSRLDYRGLHGAHGIAPDLLTMGKYLGGGASFGVFGGRAEIIDRFDPSRPGAFSHGGTFNNNVLSMSAGYAGFMNVLTEPAVAAMNDTGERLREGIAAALDRHGLAACVTGRGSLMNIHFVPGPITTPAPLDAADPRHLSLLHAELLLAGFHIAPRGMIALSLPFGDGDAAEFLAALDTILADHARHLPRRP
ncbi:aminotransferase class III-fold pyridoxal phosphate-dependent enzyme [Psychromarinibacter sp. C21-152]|uniref:Aminotransferase class III-fold pyridoxal phosphate-dependent enzyme n=1 Tax=Psychromarinibacter sediminicola TaxID=3033385 RepID=A0AAE3NLT0_9RHOB|nr:aminotransferase class III-fold pyridoxal phosphate-dependent enzyme [Psychromarinibacter sediminicola]MDF0600198.1 aminotransferase class III-fold pyridoxal phosphate-dependent enzyme [Psychromarinibacter sediminicola]